MEWFHFSTIVRMGGLIALSSSIVEKLREFFCFFARIYDCDIDTCYNGYPSLPVNVAQ